MDITLAGSDRNYENLMSILFIAKDKYNNLTENLKTFPFQDSRYYISLNLSGQTKNKMHKFSRSEMNIGLFSYQSLARLDMYCLSLF